MMKFSALASIVVLIGIVVFLSVKLESAFDSETQLSRELDETKARLERLEAERRPTALAGNPRRHRDGDAPEAMSNSTTAEKATEPSAPQVEGDTGLTAPQDPVIARKLATLVEPYAKIGEANGRKRFQEDMLTMGDPLLFLQEVVAEDRSKALSAYVDWSMARRTTVTPEARRRVETLEATYWPTLLKLQGKSRLLRDQIADQRYSDEVEKKEIEDEIAEIEEVVMRVHRERVYEINRLFEEPTSK